MRMLLRLPPLPLPIPDRAIARLFALRRIAAGLRWRTVEVDGLEIPFLEGGPSLEGGDAVVVMHGFSDDKDSFVDAVKPLVARHRVVLLDLPGFGETVVPADMPLGLFDMAAVVARFCEAVGIGRAHFVGNSLGGALATWLAIDRPALVRSLALVSPAGLVMPVPSPLQRQLDAGENPWVFDTFEGYEALMRLVLERPPTVPPAVMRYVARRYFARAQQNARLLDELLADDIDLTPRLSEIGAPALVVWGSEDRVIDLSAAHVFHERIDRARLVVLHGVGHCPQYEVPERLGPMLARFLARTHD